MSTEISKVESKAIAQLGYEEESEGGFEDATQDDYAIPFLRILQKMSPQVDEDDGAYIEGAKAGMYLNTVTLEVTREIRVIPVYFRKTIGLWTPHDEGGGFHGEITPEEAEALLGCAVRNARRDEKGCIRHPIEREWEMVEAANFYVLNVSANNVYDPALLSMASSGLGVARRWLSAMRQLKFPRADGKGMFTPPMWASVYKFETVTDSNEKGTWHTFAYEREGTNTDPEATVQAKSFKDAIKSGIVKAKDATEEPGKPLDETVDPGGEEEDIPF